MPLPTPEQLTGPDVTEAQFKSGLQELLANVASLDVVRKANYILQGQITKLEYKASSNAYIISHTALRLRQGAGRSSIFIDAANDVEIPLNSAYYVDLSGLSLSTSSTVEPVIATGWLSSSYGAGSFVDDLKYILFSWNDIPGRFGGYLLQNGFNQVLDNKLVDVNAKFPPLVTQDRKNSYIVQGKITSASYNTSAQEWTISHTRIVIMLGSGRGQVSIDAREDVVVKNNGCYYVDLLGATAGAVLIGAVVTGWASLTHGTGTFVDDMKLPLFVTTGTSGQTHGGYLVQNGGLPTISTSTAVDTINATKTATNLDFYIKGSGNNYIKYTLIKHDNPVYDPSNAYGRRQLWRLGAMSEVNPSKVVVRDSFVTGGENELAISSPGVWPDAAGGYHGDEIYTKAYFIVDGRYYPEDAVFSGDFKEIRFIQESDLLEGTATGAVFAKHIKNYSITKDGLRLEQTVKFVRDINIRNIWLGSLCIRRNLNGATGELITSTAIYPSYEVVDVSVTEGFERIARPIKTGQTMTITGDIGLSASIKVLDVNFEGYNVHVHNDAAYNKLYFNALPYSNTETLSNAITAGTEFKSTLLYKINTSN